MRRSCSGSVRTISQYLNILLSVDEKLARKLVMESERFIIDDGILCHLCYPRSKRIDQMRPVIKQLCIPKILREDIMIAYHDNNSHVGQERLYNTLKVKY